MSPFLRALAVLFFVLGSQAWAVVPTLSTPKAAPNINGSAVLSVNVTPNGADTTVTFSYGLTTAYGTSAPSVTITATSANLPQTASVSITGLTAGQTYHFMVKAVHVGESPTTSTDQTFTIAPQVSLVLPAKHLGAIETIIGNVSTNGAVGTVFFRYGLTEASTTTTVPVPVDSSTDPTQPFTFNLPTPQIYHYQFVFHYAAGTPPDVATDFAVSNTKPTAVNDVVKYAGENTITIEVLDNDTDPDGDSLIITDKSNPKNGTADLSADKQSIVYKAGPNFRGGDSFTYTIDDSYGGISSATVTIVPLINTLGGTHGGLVKKANGKEAGYFTLTTTASGAFTGIAVIEGKRYSVMGYLAADGSFNGYATGKDGAIPVQFTTVVGDTSSTITATFGNGSYVADLSVDETEGTTRAELYGRYTAALGSGSSTTATTGTTDGNATGNTPGGAGWLLLRVNPDGTAKIKGRLSDGRAFSTSGTVAIVDNVPTLTFYKDPDDTRVIGTITLADTVSGTVHTDRHSSGDGRYPRGFDLTQTVDGARYTPPENGHRALDTATSKGQDITVAYSGGGLSDSVSLNVVLDDRDRIEKVTNAGSEDLKLKVDRKGGRFNTKITVGNEGKRLKADGVIIQSTADGGSGRGSGIFSTSSDTGTVTISSTTSTTPTVPTTPTTPVVTDPVVTDPTDPALNGDITQ